MKHSSDYLRLGLVLVVAIAIGAWLGGCSDKDATALGNVNATYAQTNLVADNSGFVPAPQHIDTNLLNAWGLIQDRAGNLGVAANHSGMDIFYDGTGVPTLATFNVPPATQPGTGAPSGQVFNTSPEFRIPGTNLVTKFILSTEDGLICAWAEGPDAVIMVNPLADHSVYKGLAMAMLGGKSYLYAANFGLHRIDVFDGEWNLVEKFPFADPNIPEDYSPFNIANIDNKLYVTYAIPKPPEFMDDTAGPGHGIVDIYNPNGSFVRRFYSHGVLNSPWGVTQAPEGFGPMRKFILIGNFGDGRINVFENSGAFVTYLKMENGDPLAIDGLWAILGLSGRGSDKVYFTAGPNHEADGLFGYLRAQ